MQMGGGNALIDPSSTEARASRAKPLDRTRIPTRGASGDVLPIAIVPAPASGGGGGSGASAVPAVAPTRARVVEVNPTLAASTQPNSSNGISTPWKPASRPGGGAAMAPRGGSGGGAQPVVSAMVLGHSPRPAPPAAPAPPATIPGALTGGSQPTSAPSIPAPAITRNAAAQSLSSGAGSTSASTSPTVVSTTTPTTTVPTTIAENHSSLPSSSVAGGSAQFSFPYFQLYTLDEYSGVVLYPGQYQQATLGGNVNLIAQVSGSTGPYTYSWNTSSLSTYGSVTGASTANLQFTWVGSMSASTVEPLTLTVTDTNGHQESQTYDYVLPTSNVVTMPYSASWPTTIAPNLVEPGAPMIPSQGVSVDADSGALDTSINLPSYNPNVPALALTYNSTTANPMPIIVVHNTIPSSPSVPTTVNATLTFNGTVGTTWYYNTSSLVAGDVQQIALQASATSLSTGRYSYSVQVVDEGSTNTTSTYTGTATVLNGSTSAFGDGWTLSGLEQVIPATGGVILTLGNNGESEWFSGSPGVGGSYTSPAGDFSTLTLTSGGYTRTLTDGTQITFNSSGYETATIDLNGLHTTYSYNGSNQLASIEDPYGNRTTFTYSSGYLQSILDPAGRLTTFTMSGSNLDAVEQADGSFVTYTYDGSGRLTEYQDQRTNVTTIAYDSAGRVGTITEPDGGTQLISSDQEQGWTNSGTSGSPTPATLLAVAATHFTDPNGNAFEIQPDWMGLGQVDQTIDPYGDVTTNDLNANGEPIVSIDALNRITQYNDNSSGMPVTITYPDLTSEHATYNSDSEPLTETNQDGNTTTFTYDGNGNLDVIQDPMHNLTTMTYTADGQVQSVTNANDHTTTYLYDNQDRVTTVQFPNGTTNLYAYSAAGQVTQITDGRGNATTYSYDPLNRETGMTDALGNHTTYVYDAVGNMTQEQAPTPAGQTARTTNYAYDSMDRLTTVTDPMGNATVVRYDDDGKVTSVTDPMGRITTYQYDALDRQTVEIDPMGNATTTTYDADGEKLTVTDALNRTTTYTYSVRGWVSTVTDPLGYVATYTYSATGKNLAASQQEGSGLQIESNTYNADDELSSSTDGLGNVTTYLYDGVGNQVSVEAPNGSTTTYVYNSMNQVIEEVQPLGVTVSFTYDNSGNQQTVTDALGHTTTTLYDALDQATTIVSAVGGITTITYDVAGRETSLTDPDENTTTWSYDADDLVTTITDPNGSTVTSVYDADNELIDTTDQDGRRTTYSYDKDGDNTGESWVNGSGTAIYIATYTYDADHELTSATDPYATLTFTYDKNGDMLSEVTSGPGSGQPTVTLTYSYDQLGDETSVTDSLSNQGVISYAYNADEEITTITQAFGGSVGPQISFGYNNASQLTAISRQTGTSSTATEVNTSITYDAANRVVTMTDGVASYTLFLGGSWSTTPLATYVYSYDDADRETSETDAEGVYSYTYDNANELTGVTENGTAVGTYSYDLNGNRTGTGYTTGTDNEQTASPGFTYTYDDAGNMISATNTSTSVTTTYTYDYENRLTEVTTGGTVVATYTYNALNQRIGVKDSGTQTWTIYDGASPDANPYADFNGSGSLTVRYLFGPTVVNGAVTTGILARTSSGGTTAFYLTDKLGSVRDIVSTTGTDLDHIVYDSFGNILSQSDSANGDRFMFAGMEYDSATGQYYDRARYFDEVIGRFMSEDPKGFVAGDNDLYRYVENGPTNEVDPSGLTDPDQVQPPTPAQFQTMMQSPLVQAEMPYVYRQYRKKNPRPENMRLIMWNPTTGQVAPTSIGVTVGSKYNAHADNPNIPGWFVMGTFHTHYGTGRTGLSPSRPDIQDSPQPPYPGATFNLQYFQVYMPDSIIMIDTPSGPVPQVAPGGILPPVRWSPPPIGSFPNPPGSLGPITS
ncbi:MAG: RHS repeat-associated core domain-containing protein [Isosphaeraceae bacterium]